MKYSILLAVALSLLLSPPSNAGSLSYNKWYKGVATYYGHPPVTHCQLPLNYMGLQTVALNGPQYDGSKNCGTCARVKAAGKGLGHDPIKGDFMVVMTDSCFDTPSPVGVCGYGHFDFAAFGDGWWEIEWTPVPCPQKKPVVFRFYGSNQWYIKVQAIYLDSPMAKLSVNGQVKSQPTMDNHYEFQAGPNGHKWPVTLKVWTALGSVYTTTVSLGELQDGKEYVARKVSGGNPAPNPNPKPGPGGKPGGNGGKKKSRRCGGIGKSGKRKSKGILKVVNRKPFPIKLYNVNINKKLVLVKQIQSKQSFRFQTWKNSVWRVTKMSGKCVRVFRFKPPGKRRIVRIGGH